MQPKAPSAIAEEWIAAWSSTQAPVPAIGNGVSALDRELPRENPNLCLAAILEVLTRIDVSTPNRLLSVLAAGPLEDLLVHSGHVVLNDVDILARRDPAFRLLLNGVWSNRIAPDVLETLAKYRNNPW